MRYVDKSLVAVKDILYPLPFSVVNDVPLTPIIERPALESVRALLYFHKNSVVFRLEQQVVAVSSWTGQRLNLSII